MTWSPNRWLICAARRAESSICMTSGRRSVSRSSVWSAAGTSAICASSAGNALSAILPEMVADAPTLAELTPRIKEIFAGADNLIAYGVSTDFSHIKLIYQTESERAALRRKIRCAATEYTRFMQEHHPELTHTSLTDAMACLGIEWDGVAHTSIADTIGCMKVWEALFPHYYED